MAGRMVEAARIRFHEAQVAEVVLVNPGRLNAMDPVFFTELAAIFTGIAESRAVRAVVLRAEGRAFSIGLDKEMSMNLLPPPRAGEPPAGRTTLLHQTIRRFQAALMTIRSC